MLKAKGAYTAGSQFIKGVSLTDAEEDTIGNVGMLKTLTGAGVIVAAQAQV